MGSRRKIINYTTLWVFYISISATTLFAQCDATKYAEKFKPQNQKLPKSLIETENNLNIGHPVDFSTLEVDEPSSLKPQLAFSSSDSISLSPQNSPPLFCVYPPIAPQAPPPPHYGPGRRPSPLKPTRSPPGPPPPEHKRPKFAVWCVAKPTVPASVLQGALDYACGTRAKCRPIQPNGRCFQPNTLLAHASYAFNSYFQSTKLTGGTCDFGGTAMLVTDDPSYDGCHFLFT